MKNLLQLHSATYLQLVLETDQWTWRYAYGVVWFTTLHYGDAETT
jgi:hypothetical protein